MSLSRFKGTESAVAFTSGYAANVSTITSIVGRHDTVICDDDWAALRLAKYCQQRGFYVQGIPHPVVPKGSARLRVSITAGHSKEQLDRFAAVLDQGLDELAISRDGSGQETGLAPLSHRTPTHGERGLEAV